MWGLLCLPKIIEGVDGLKHKLVTQIFGINCTSVLTPLTLKMHQPKDVNISHGFT